MTNKTRTRLLWLIAAVWAANSVVLPVVVKDWEPDPAINGAFMLAATAVYAQPVRRSTPRRDESR